MAESDKQLRQRVNWAISRAENLVNEGRISLEHLEVILTELNERIEGPPGAGLWVNMSELQALPISGVEWDEMLEVASSPWPYPINLHDQNGKANIHIMAGALVYARVGEYRSKVTEYIRSLINEGFNTSTTALSWARNTGAFVIAADLIRLEEIDPSLDQEFRNFMREIITYHNVGDGMNNLIDGALHRPNNIGSYCRFSLTAIAGYLDDQALIEDLANLARFYLGERDALPVDPFDNWGGPSSSPDYSWQEDPRDQVTYRGIVRTGVHRDGNNFDGIQPEEMRRGGEYDARTFPGMCTHRYVEENLGAVLGTIILLERLGYPARTWGEQAALRAAVRLNYFADAHSGQGWTYFSGAHEASRPLVNYLYGGNLPQQRSRSQYGGAAKGFAWTHWTHS